MEEEDAPREETLSDYLQEYGSQSWRFKEHLDSQGFCKLKEARSSSHRRSKRGRIFLSHFDGSAECTTQAWVEEVASYFHLHQVSEKEAIRVAALHLKGMAHDWWFNGSTSFCHANVKTYVGFTK